MQNPNRILLIKTTFKVKKRWIVVYSDAKKKLYK